MGQEAPHERVKPNLTKFALTWSNQGYHLRVKAFKARAMTTAVNVYEAKTQLSALLERAASGEDVIIAKAGKPVARLTRLAGATGTIAPNGVRFGGLDAQLLNLAPDFHAPMTDADLLTP